jgi:hypothetical protein
MERLLNAISTPTLEYTFSGGYVKTPLLEIEMVRLEEVFLPYVVNAQGKTLFEVFESYQFQLPLPPEESFRYHPLQDIVPTTIPSE